MNVNHSSNETLKMGTNFQLTKKNAGCSYSFVTFLSESKTSLFVHSLLKSFVLICCLLGSSVGRVGPGTVLSLHIHLESATGKTLLQPMAYMDRIECLQWVYRDAGAYTVLWMLFQKGIA